MYLALARKYRPRTFDQLIGQDPIVRVLRNSLEQNRLHHSYIMCGTRGSGKTSTARLLSKCLNCINGSTATPCLICDHCVAIENGTCTDVIEIDAASNNGVDSIRDLKSNTIYQPTVCRKKCWIIDECHQLSKQAWDAFLKVLEEPSDHVQFIFATTVPDKLPATVVSRAIRLNFLPVRTNDLVRLLLSVAVREGCDLSEAAARLIARQATGSVRDALSLLDQIIAFGDTPITVTTVQSVLGLPDEEAIIQLVDHILNRRFSQIYKIANSANFDILDALANYYRDLMIFRTTQSSELLNIADDRLTAHAKLLTLDDTLEGLRLIAEAGQQSKTSGYGKILVEMLLTRLALSVKVQKDDLTLVLERYFH